jgi:hypothetical protein
MMSLLLLFSVDDSIEEEAKIVVEIVNEDYIMPETGRFPSVAEAADDIGNHNCLARTHYCTICCFCAVQSWYIFYVILSGRCRLHEVLVVLNVTFYFGLFVTALLP